MSLSSPSLGMAIADGGRPNEAATLPPPRQGARIVGTAGRADDGDKLRFARQTRYFEVYVHGTSPSAHEALLAVIDRGAERVAAALGHTFPTKTRLVIAGSREHFNAALPSGVHLPDTVAGVALHELGLIVLHNAPDIARTFVHEASHIALLAATAPARPPRWFIEGFAAYQAQESNLGRLEALTRASVGGALIPLRDLEDYFPLHEGHSDLAYAQSNEMITYLLGTFGQARFQALISRLGRREPFFQALEAAYGKTLRELESAYVEDLRVRYNWVPVITGTVTLYLIVSIIFLLAYVRKRRQTRQRLAQMEDEEAESDILEIPDPLPRPPFTEGDGPSLYAVPPDDEPPPRPPTLH